RAVPHCHEAGAQSREKVTVPVMVGGDGPRSPHLEPLSQSKRRLGATDKCYPTDQLMHQVMDWFVRQPPTNARVQNPPPRHPRLPRRNATSYTDRLGRSCSSAPA